MRYEGIRIIRRIDKIITGLNGRGISENDMRNRNNKHFVHLEGYVNDVKTAIDNLQAKYNGLNDTLPEWDKIAQYQNISYKAGDFLAEGPVAIVKFEIKIGNQSYVGLQKITHTPKGYDIECVVYKGIENKVEYVLHTYEAKDEESYSLTGMRDTLIERLDYDIEDSKYKKWLQSVAKIDYHELEAK